MKIIDVMNDLIDRVRNEKLIFTFNGKKYFLDHVDSYQHGEDFGLFFRLELFIFNF
ncbi:hypothetical protein [Campylobacter phage CJLB-14]|nr:hypothetical protein [Campylobacter phage CJLB-14]